MGFRSFIKGRVKQAIGRDPSTSTQAGELREALRSLPKAADPDGYHAVAPVHLITEGRGNTFVVSGHNVAVFRYQGQLFAIDDACAHEDGPLGEGTIEDGVVTCPYHDWRYKLDTGACLTEPTRAVSCFAVRENGGFVWVGARTREGTNARGGQHDDGLKTAPVEAPER